MSKMKVKKGPAFWKLVVVVILMLHSTLMTSSTTPSTCVKKDGNVQTCDIKQADLCSVNRDGSMGGCASSSQCAKGESSNVLICDDDVTTVRDLCCCNADNCNNLKVKEIKDIFCKYIPDAAVCHLVEGKENLNYNKCLKKDDSIEQCKVDQITCELLRSKNNVLTQNGCAKGKDACPLKQGEDITCHEHKCCCRAKGSPCNDKNNQMILNDKNNQMILNDKNNQMILNDKNNQMILNDKNNQMIRNDDTTFERKGSNGNRETGSYTLVLFVIFAREVVHCFYYTI